MDVNLKNCMVTIRNGNEDALKEHHCRVGLTGTAEEHSTSLRRYNPGATSVKRAFDTLPAALYGKFYVISSKQVIKIKQVKLCDH